MSSVHQHQNQNPTAVVFLGMLGHGKTFLLNKVTGSFFPSTPSIFSCTETIQHSRTIHNDILVIDTPGTGSSKDVPKHIAAQKVALEGIPLSGIYTIVKINRVDVIARDMEPILDFVGDHDVRIIVTHADTIGFDSSELKSALSTMVDIPIEHIAVVGISTTAKQLDDFLRSTLHAPKTFSVKAEQTSLLASIGMRNNKALRMLKIVYARLDAALRKCQEIAQREERSYRIDVLITAVQRSISNLVQNRKKEIFQEAMNLSPDAQNLVYGKAGLGLSLALQRFIESTNSLLSWDVTDASDPRNVYKKCECGAIYNKVEGCDDDTTCGAVPTFGDSRRGATRSVWLDLEENDDGGLNFYFGWNGSRLGFDSLWTQLSSIDSDQPRTNNGERNHIKRSNAMFESGCGATISWRTMTPLSKEEVAELGAIETIPEVGMEKEHGMRFQDFIEKKEEENVAILKTAISDATRTMTTPNNKRQKTEHPNPVTPTLKADEKHCNVNEKPLLVDGTPKDETPLSKVHATRGEKELSCNA